MKRYRRTGNAIWRLCIHVSSGRNFCSSLLARAALANPDYRLPDVAIVPLFIAIQSICWHYCHSIFNRIDWTRHNIWRLEFRAIAPLRWRKQSKAIRMYESIVFVRVFGVYFFSCSIACVAWVEYRWLEFVMGTHVEIHRIVAKMISWEFCLSMCVQTQLLNWIPTVNSGANNETNVSRKHFAVDCMRLRCERHAWVFAGAFEFLEMTLYSWRCRQSQGCQLLLLIFFFWRIAFQFNLRLCSATFTLQYELSSQARNVVKIMLIGYRWTVGTIAINFAQFSNSSNEMIAIIWQFVGDLIPQPNQSTGWELLLAYAYFSHRFHDMIIWAKKGFEKKTCKFLELCIEDLWNRLEID